MGAKKTAIVSCYFFHNYGSMLQAYATQKALNVLGVENETINVSGFLKSLRSAQYKYILKSGIKSDIFKEKIGKAKNIFYKKFVRNQYTENIKKRDVEFEKFYKQKINVSESFSSVRELSTKCSDLYSTFLVGSDQLWLPSNIAADYYTLSFVPDNINTVSYATSFGVSCLPEDIINKSKEFLSRIKHLSVREKTGQKIVKDLTDRFVPVVCDPTLLFSGNEWIADMPQKDAMIKEPYIFCYFLGDVDTYREFACRLRAFSGYKIVALIHLDQRLSCDEGYADYTPFDIGPFEFLNLIKNAQYVCTDSFHCSVFSILFKKIFFSFRRHVISSSQSTSSRLDTLFEIIGLNRFYLGNEDIERCLSASIDWDEIEINLQKVREYSLFYLKKAIENNENTDLEACYDSNN